MRAQCINMKYSYIKESADLRLIMADISPIQHVYMEGTEYVCTV